MKSLLLTLALVGLSSCATTKHTWKTGEADANTATIKTPWGEVTLKPGMTNAIGLYTEVTVKNTSAEDINFRVDSIKLTNEQGETTDALPPDQIQSRVDGAMAFNHALIGGSYATAKAANSKVSSDIAETLLRDGKILSHSTKRGQIIFAEPKDISKLSFRLAKDLSGSDATINFLSADPVKSGAAQY
jgi:hypothetical protein